MRRAWPVTPRATCWGRGGWGACAAPQHKGRRRRARAVARLSILQQRRPPPEQRAAYSSLYTQSEWDNITSEGSFCLSRSSGVTSRWPADSQIAHLIFFNFFVSHLRLQNNFCGVWALDGQGRPGSEVNAAKFCCWMFSSQSRPSYTIVASWSCNY